MDTENKFKVDLVSLKLRFKLIEGALASADRHCVCLAGRVANELQKNVRHDIQKLMVKWLDRDRKGDPFTREHFNHLFFTNIIIAVSEIIKEIDRHEHILIDEDADRKIFCDCKLN